MKYKYLFTLLGLFLNLCLTIQVALGDISYNECVNFDHTQKMGPIRDQREVGVCWAFAGTALLEEEACREYPHLCGKNLSPLDAARCDWPLGKKEQGGFIHQGVDCALQNGICLEENAPYNEMVDLNLTCTKPLPPEDTKKKHHPHCADINTQREYQDFLSDFNNHKIEFQCTEPHQGTNALAAFISSHDDIADETLRREKDHKLSAEGLFRKKMLITPKCENQRHKLGQGQKLITHHKTFSGGVKNITKTPAKNKYHQLANIFQQNNRSAALSVCLNKISPELALLFAPEENNCSGHGIVANGSKWIDGECKIHIKNSWGMVPKGNPVKGQLDGWVSAKKVMDATFQMDFIGPKQQRQPVK